MSRISTITFLFLLTAFPVFAQYTPVTLDGQVFFKIELEVDNNVLLSEITVADFDFFDNVYYSRVFLKQGLSGDMLIGHIREDATVGELYFRPIDGSDQLAFDISLSLGDSITLHARWCDGIADDVAHVIAEEEIDGRKVLTFDREIGHNQICETLQFIEGIGPTGGIISPWLADNTPNNGVALRICHAVRNGTVFYPEDSNIDLCGNVPVAVEEPNSKSWSIYPNPTQEQVFIKTDLTSFALKLYDFSGHLLLQTENEKTLNISTLPKGMYLVEITENGRSTKREKLIKL